MTTSTLFPPAIEAYRFRIDEALQGYTRFDDDCPEKLAEAIRYCLLAPGKRFRPLLVLVAAEMCGGSIEDAIPAACAVEMIHNYSLIHDDLPAMDDDDLRRGRPTCHVAFDEATAVLAGDALIPMAFEVLVNHIQPANIAAQCVAALAYASGPSQLVGGQADDLGFQFADADLDSLEKIHRRKTGALISVSLKLGGLTAGADPEKLQSLTQYGKHLGLAFQIVDDLLDLQGSQAKMGKKAGKDAGLGKLTYPALIGAQESQLRAQQMCQHAIDALAPFGDDAETLTLLAQFVVERNQ
ncbi:polyprenyl synthetase family protein [bacterium]|nr:polyprenyl synthetase family protein [bacterium]